MADQQIVVNLREALAAAEGGFEGPMQHYNGGWVKIITALDKSHDNGYSLVGDFIKRETVQAHQTPGLYLDCDIGRSRKNQTKYYTLFELRADGTAVVLETLSERAGRTSDWAIRLWPFVEGFFAEKETPPATAEDSAAASSKIPATANYEQLKRVARAADAMQKFISDVPALNLASHTVPGFDPLLCELESALGACPEYRDDDD